MASPTASGQATNPVCGDVVHVFVKIESGTIVAATFEAQGCPPTIAAASVLTEIVTGRSIDEAKELSPGDVTRALGGLPRNKEHCSLVVVDALQAALKGLNQTI